ncbi:MAG: hypothetical protein J0I06_05385 [Planctomycetes bacterium]|nr:hypothetical protein [Planctomycetota bacterium]
MNSLFTHFAHDRGPSEARRAVAVADAREWPRLWKSDPRLAPLLGDAEAESLVRSEPGRLRYFAATDPAHPNVPLVRANADIRQSCDAFAPRLPPGTTIRDKFWQRLVVEAAGCVPQPGFAAVNGSRIEACHAPWSVRVEALDVRPVRAELFDAAVPGAVVVVEAADIGFTATASENGVLLTTRSPYVAACRNGPEGRPLSYAEWGRLVDALCAAPLPLGAEKVVFNPSAELGDALSIAPGSYILKPRFGSNGVAVVRIRNCADGAVIVESDCPDTARYLEEFPRDARLCGRDLIVAATQRGRFIDRALAGIPEQALARSVLEEEIVADRVDGSVFEPRIVVQRVRAGSGESFATLGALCKRIDTAVAASVARDFREEPLDVSLHRFLSGRVPAGELTRRVEQTRDEILAVGDRLRAVVVPLIEARGRVHQFGIDCRLCWNTSTGRVEFPFLEFQLGIGRIDVPLAGYKTRGELLRLFGPEIG